MISLSIPVIAQSNFYTFSVGAGAGLTQSFADVRKHDIGPAGYITADYMFSPFLSLGLELQAGQINGGDKKTDPYHRQFINNYKSITGNGKVYLGAFTDYQRKPFLNAIKGLYAGAGLGVILNQVDAVRTDPVTGARYPGPNESKDLCIPLNLGINFYFPDFEGNYRYILNFNYQGNITLGEGLDGYDDSAIRLKTGNPDVYTYFSVGFKYNFGSLGLTSKNFKRN